MAFSFNTATPVKTPAPGSFSFGAKAPGTTGGFGTTTNPAAPGTTSTFGGFGGFGATNTTTTAQQPAPAPAFGGFGSAPSQQPAPAPSAFGGFGSVTAPKPTPAFGTFGSTASNPAPAFGAFGAPAQAAPAPAFGGFQSQPQQQQQNQQQTIANILNKIPGHTPYSALPDEVRREIDAIYNLMMKHKHTMATVQSLAPALLSHNTAAQPDLAAGVAQQKESPLLQQVQDLQTNLRLLATSTEKYLADVKELRYYGEQTAKSTLQNAYWPVQAISGRRGVAIPSLSKHQENHQHFQIITSLASDIDRIENIPSPFLWNFISSLESDIAGLQFNVTSLQTQFKLLSEQHQLETQNTHALDPIIQITSIITSLNHSFRNVAANISQIHSQMDAVKNCIRQIIQITNSSDPFQMADIAEAEETRRVDDHVKNFVAKAQVMANNVTAAQPKAPTTSLFGATTQAPATTTNLFGTNIQAPAPTTNLFGTQQPAPAPTTNLFNTNTQASAPTNLFGVNSQTSAPATNLFGAQQPAPSPTTNLFGAKQPAPAPLFGNTSKQPAPAPFSFQQPATTAPAPFGSSFGTSTNTTTTTKSKSKNRSGRSRR